MRWLDGTTDSMDVSLNVIECYIDNGGSFKKIADGYAKYKASTSGLNININTEE